jgi:hypothetical protein
MRALWHLCGWLFDYRLWGMDWWFAKIHRLLEWRRKPSLAHCVDQLIRSPDSQRLARQIMRKSLAREAPKRQTPPEGITYHYVEDSPIPVFMTPSPKSKE